MKSIPILGYRNIYLRFIDIGKIIILKNTLYIPLLGINLISTYLLKDIVLTFISTSIYICIKSTNKLITIRKPINRLYYLFIKVLKSIPIIATL